MNKRLALCASGWSMAILWASGVIAEPAPRAGAIEEIIVTATYRETNLMETPQAISAIGAGLVQDLGAQSMEDIYTLVPGLSMSGTQNGESRYTIRGITSQGGSVGYAPAGATVGVYLDGTPVTAALGPDNQISGTLFDIERVEVLKGPQGTLFGEGSQSGTIRYLYKQPDPTKFDVAVNGSFASMEESDDMSHRLDAMINVPLAEGTALRVTAWRSETAGYIDNLNPSEEDFNTGKSTGARAAVSYEGEKFGITGSIYHSEQETEGGVATFRAYEAQLGRITGLEPESLDELDIFSLTVEVDLGWAVLQSETSYTDREITSVSESAASGAAILDYFYGGSTLADPNDPNCVIAAAFGICPGFPGVLNPPPPLPPTFTGDGKNLEAISNRGDSYSERWVQELRLVSPGDKRFRWTLGAFWKDSEDHTGNSQVAGYFPGREAFGGAFGPLLSVPANTHTDFLEEYSLFGEASYDITDTLELTVGVRVSDLEQSFTNTGTGTDDRPVSPKVVLSWRPMDDLLLFASYATGFRPGNVSNNMEFYAQGQELIRQGVLADTSLTDAERAAAVASIDESIDAFLSNLFFDGDDVDSYELGVKSTLLEGRVAVLASVYYLDWKDMIIHENHPLNGDIYNANSGGADIQGFEMEINAFVTDRFNVRVAGDFNDTEVTQASALSSAADGNELIYSPNKSLSIALDYSLPMANGWRLDFHADRAWVGKQYIDSANTIELPSYQKSNGRITLRSPDQKWRVALFGTNLEDEEILRGSTTTGILYWYSPRQVGLEVGYQL